MLMAQDMQKPPDSLLNDFSRADQAALRAWWCGLHDDDRDNLQVAFDSRWDDCSFGFFADADEKVLPVVETRSFLKAWRPSRQDDSIQEQWLQEFREFLQQNPDAIVASMFCEIHFLNWMNGSRAYTGFATFRISGPMFVGETHFLVDWSRIKCPPRQLPPSQQRRRR
jgi:hypothetical protein